MGFEVWMIPFVVIGIFLGTLFLLASIQMRKNQREEERKRQAYGIKYCKECGKILDWYETKEFDEDTGELVKITASPHRCFH